jgi:putative nucleotidyltransferase with HDIG domain
MVNNKRTLFDKLLSEKETEENDLKNKSNSKLWIRIIIVIISILFSTFFFSIHFNKRANETILSNVVPGYIWPNQTLKANYSFSIFKDDFTYQKEVKEAIDKTPTVFLQVYDAQTQSEKNLDSMISIVSAGTKISDQFKSTKKAKATDTKIKERTIDYKLISKSIISLFSTIYKGGLININLESLKNDEISVKLDEINEKILPKSVLSDFSTYSKFAASFLKTRLKDDNYKIALEIAEKSIVPNLMISTKLTDAAKELSKLSVPKTIGIVRQGEVVIVKGQKATEEIIRKLVSYEYTRQIKETPKYEILTILGSAGHATLLYSILFFYLYFLRKKIFYSTFSFGLISGTLLLSAFLGWLSIEIPTRFPIEYLVLIPGLSMLVAILYDSRTAFYTIVVMAIMLAGIRGNDYDVGTAMLFSGTLAAFTVRDIQSRTQMFRSIFFIFIGFIVSIVSFGLERSLDTMQIIYKLSFSLVNAAISPLFTYALIFIIEKISNTTTDLKLSEFANLNHKILVKMSEFAPGTYQHTMQVAMLAEKCAVAIEANGLLAKVGAYYHDIGKIPKPEYFVENQLNMINKHDALTSKKSAEAIRNHVTEGIKLAKEYKLPQRIIDFIPMHHGTSLIKHFYAKALEEAKDQEINENDYRYTGPKPNSKETAILMICDQSEALSRLENKSSEELEIILSKNINEKLLDGQFEECNLTFKELQIIKDTCLKHLTGIGHKRIEYKELPKTNQ